jgi:hypothetical protein
MSDDVERKMISSFDLCAFLVILSIGYLFFYHDCKHTNIGSSSSLVVSICFFFLLVSFVLVEQQNDMNQCENITRSIDRDRSLFDLCQPMFIGMLTCQY